MMTNFQFIRQPIKTAVLNHQHKLQGLCCMLSISLLMTGCQNIKPEPLAAINIQQQFSQPRHYGLHNQQWEIEGWKIAQPSDSLPKGQWWRIFHDPQLNGLMDALNQNNLSIVQYQAQYRQAQALLQQARAGRQPGINANLGVNRAKDIYAKPVSDFSSNVTAAWEIDLWGKIQQNILVNQEKVRLSEAQLNNMRLSMQSQLVAAYLQWVILGFQLEEQRNVVGNFKKALSLTQNQYHAGIIASTVVDQAKSQYQSAATTFLDIKLSRIQMQHAIAVLIAQPIDQLSLTTPHDLPVLPQIPVSIPAKLLQRRFDIASAEREMAAANAQVGVARLAVYPDLSLGGSFGYGNSRLMHLFNTRNEVWAVGPNLAVSIFDGGLKKALTQQALAAYDVTIAQYKQTVYTAFQEVENNMAAQYFLAQESKQIDSSLVAAVRAEKTSFNQYKAGMASYLNLLNAQNNRIDVQNSLWSIRNRQYLTCVSLISALGGQWD